MQWNILPRVWFLITLLTTPLVAHPASATNISNATQMQVNAIFIFDSSGSMRDTLHGTPKVQAAKMMVEKAIEALPPNAKLGLITFGHREQKSCSDIEVMVPIGPNNQQEILTSVNALEPKGTTPLGIVLQKAADMLKTSQGAKVIILITDGADECDANPCAIARSIASSGVVVRVNTIGIHPNSTARSQLHCIAKEGGGRYFQISDKRSLYKAMSDIQTQIKKHINEETAPDGTINLLQSENGVQVISSGYTNWRKSISGNKEDSTWAWPGQSVIFAFKDRRMARFSQFALAIPETLSQNVKEFELLVSDGGPYYPIGTFKTENTRTSDTLYQIFKFPERTGRFLKLKVISNYGHQMEGYGNTQIFQMKLIGKLLGS